MQSPAELGWNSDIPAFQGWGFLVFFASSRHPDGWQWLGHRTVLIVPGVHRSYWRTLVVFGVRLTEWGLLMISDSGIPCRGQGLWETCPDALAVCLAVAPVTAEWRHQGWRFCVSRWPSLGWREGCTERFFSAFVLGFKFPVSHPEVCEMRLFQF